MTSGNFSFDRNDNSNAQPRCDEVAEASQQKAFSRGHEAIEEAVRKLSSIAEILASFDKNAELQDEPERKEEKKPAAKSNSQGGSAPSKGVHIGARNKSGKWEGFKTNLKPDDALLAVDVPKPSREDLADASVATVAVDFSHHDVDDIAAKQLRALPAPHQNVKVVRRTPPN